MRIEERTSHAADCIAVAIDCLNNLRHQEEMTQDVYSMVRESLDDAKHSLLQSRESGLRTERKKWIRQHAVFKLMEAHAIVTKTNYYSESRERIQAAIFSLIV